MTDVDVDDIDQKLKKYNLNNSENLFKFKVNSSRIFMFIKKIEEIVFILFQFHKY